MRTVSIVGAPKGKGKVCIRAKCSVRPALISVFYVACNMSISTPPSPHLLKGCGYLPELRLYLIRWYSFIQLGGERHCESKVSCQEHRAMSPVRVRTRTARSRTKRTKHETSVGVPGRIRLLLGILMNSHNKN